LSCWASSYKEVGEYKKAVADCIKIYFSSLLMAGNSSPFLDMNDIDYRIFGYKKHTRRVGLKCSG
jgi:hypothetical protein